MVEIYYLEDGKYVLQENYILQDDKDAKDYNAKTVIRLRAFPQVEMTLDEIFEDMDWGAIRTVQKGLP